MERTKTFVNGGRLYPADINAIEDRAAEMLEGTAAAIPSSHFAGRFYRATDTKQLSLDNGTSWEKVLGTDPGTYTALTERASATEFEPSATLLTLVSASVSLTIIEKQEVTAAFFVGGVRMANPGLSNSTLGSTIKINSTVTFLVPPKVKWKWVKESAGEALVASSYYTM